MDKIVEEGRALTGLKTFDTTGQRSQDRMPFGAREPLSDAGVHPEPERELSSVISKAGQFREASAL